MWNPQVSQELLKQHLPTTFANNNFDCWVNNLYHQIIQIILDKNNGNLNNITPLSINTYYDKIVARLPTRQVPYLPNGASCFCGSLCDCSRRMITQHNVRDLKSVVSDIPWPLTS